jgi:hypothetical protein
VEVLGDQRCDVLVDDLGLPAFGVGDESRPVLDPVDVADRRLEDGVRVRGDRNHRTERHRRMRCREVGGLDVLNVTERLLDGGVDVGRWVVRPQSLVTEDLDPSVVEVQPDFVGNLTEVLAVKQLDGMGIIVLLEAGSVLLGGVGESTGGDDHLPLRTVEVERRDGRMELLNDRAPDRPRVLTLDDDRAAGTVDNLLHDDVAALVGRPLSLADVLVAEVAEHVLELKPRELVQYSHPDIPEQYVATVKYVAERSPSCFLTPREGCGGDRTSLPRTNL